MPVQTETELPDRIWAERDDETNEKRWFSIKGMGVEYVRANLPATQPDELNGIAEQLAEGSGFWRACSGCHELNEGVPMGTYSSIMKCHLGMGCHECGGIGAVWDNTDYEDMGRFMAADYLEASSPAQPESGLLAEAVKAPTGYVLVPIKPTKEMAYQAACYHYGKRRVDRAGGIHGIAMTVDSHDYDFWHAFKKFWKAAIANAPAPLAAPAQPVEAQTQEKVEGRVTLPKGWEIVPTRELMDEILALPDGEYTERWKAELAAIDAIIATASEVEG